jgi:hypothetical protein
MYEFKRIRPLRPRYVEVERPSDGTNLGSFRHRKITVTNTVFKIGMSLNDADRVKRLSYCID